jgi:enamine deaminase RidA (YjgF/YER057c/UK114 family)
MQMKQALNPAEIRAPFARYSHAIEVPTGARMVFASGQLGVGPDDRVPATIEGQTELCFGNIRAILSAAAMDMNDVVRINAFVTRRDEMAGYMAVRDRTVGDPPPASTLVIVSGFTRPEFLVEIEVVAAKVD